MTAPPRRRFRPDRGLAARMLLTVFLLGLVYVAFVAVLIAVGLSPVLVIVIAGGLLFTQYWFSDRIALYGMRGRIVTPQQAPELHGMIDRLCTLADLPKPAVAVADVDVPNAFATGRSPRRSVVCVTTGLTRRLDTDELTSVLSHELSHVAHRDVAVMTVAAFLGVLAGLITRFGLYSGMYGGFGGNNRDDDEDSGAAAVAVIVVVSALVYAVSFVLTRSLSRFRELAADRSGALLTGRPRALASALTKITGEMSRIPTRDLRTAEPFNAFFFAPARAGGFSLSTLFSTHPPLDARLAQLARLSAELEEPSAGLEDPPGSVSP
ncbi:zinc metalloprotease HtpX [Protofrankia symbiont of Coriaria ruscifolia]|uniref:zinc metalloprotease HtpX n=1 Tax=Protofrankia symbiont of Coriaria ruscifolia TaxID=1306542 RepID=UPI0010411B82|nr:zinc metalloprotease HtpX [Protofrankia symbiont of Coriaria ruscifolia]